VAAVPEHDENSNERQHLERRQEDRIDVRDVERCANDLVGAAAETGRERRAGAEPLHDADPRDRLLDERRRLAELLLVDPRPLRVAPRVAAEADAHERQRREHGDREVPVDREQDGRGPDYGQDVADRVPDRVERACDELGVVGRAGDQLACTDSVVVAGVELESPAEDRIAHLRVGARAVADREVVSGCAADRLHTAECYHPGACPPERAGMVVDDPGVDRVANEERRRDRCALPGEA